MTIEGLTSLPTDLYSILITPDITTQQDVRSRVSVAVRITSLAMTALAAGVTLLTSALPLIGPVTLLAGIATCCFAYDLFACGAAIKTDMKPEFLFFEALHTEDISLPVLDTIIQFIAELVLPSVGWT